MKKEILREEWRDVEGYGGYYQVSSLGRVKTLTKILTPFDDGNGYLRVVLSKNNRKKYIRVHVLVLSAFVGSRPLKFDACHRNDIRTDNWLDNLYWGTRSENIKESVRNGKLITGEDHHSAIYTDNVIAEIRSKFPEVSAINLSKEFDVSIRHIYMIVNNETRKYG